jgi:DNA-binding MarR family transcriptional regulator
MPTLAETAERESDPRTDAKVRWAASRLILRFIKTRLLEGAKLFGDDLTATLVFVAITRANVDHVDEERALFERWSDLDAPPPDEIRRPASGYMAAQWLGLSRETVRRKLNSLIAMGMIERVEDGYRSPARALATPEVEAVTARNMEAAGALFRSLAQLGLVEPALVKQAGEGPPRPRMASRALNAFVPPMLDSLQTLTDHDLTSAVVLAAIVTSSMANPPERPSALGLVERLGLPRETARRHVAALEARGLVVRTRTGLVAPDAVIEGPVQRAIMDRGQPYLKSLIARLAQAGVLAPPGPKA